MRTAISVSNLLQARTNLFWAQSLSVVVVGGWALTSAAAGLPFASGLPTTTPVLPGQVLQSVKPAPSLPSAPNSVLVLPPPYQQHSESLLTVKVSRIVFSGPAMLELPELQTLAKPYEGKSQTLGELQTFTASLTERFKKEGYPLAYAYIPQQTMNDGVLQINLVEPRYNHITFVGDSRLKESEARYTLGLHSGECIVQQPLSRGLLLLQQTPGVTVQGVFVPGQLPKTSSLEVHVHDKPYLRVNYGINNYGNGYSGRWQYQLGLTLQDPFGYGSEIGINGLTSEAGLLHSGGFNVLSPNLWNGLRVGVYGSRTIYRLGGVFSPLGASGAVNQIGVQASYPIILQPGRLLQADVNLIHDGISSDNSTIGRYHWHINMVRLGLSGARAWEDGGVTSGGVSVTYGGLAYDNAESEIAQASGPGVAGNFWVSQLQLAQRQPLPKGFVFHAAFSGQIASRNLDGTQKFYLGGPFGVMSYPVGAAGGDDGLLLRLRLSHALPIPEKYGDLRADLLGQTGTVWKNHTPFNGVTGPNQETLSGLGVGLNYNYHNYAVLDVAYVHQVGGTNTPVLGSHGGEVWVGLHGQF